MATIQLIDQNTGKPDHVAIAEFAKLRAAREYGSPDFPPTYLRRALEWTNQRAQDERIAWRRDHGLADDSVYSGYTVTPYGKQVNGVRMSAF